MNAAATSSSTASSAKWLDSRCAPSQRCARRTVGAYAGFAPPTACRHTGAGRQVEAGEGLRWGARATRRRRRRVTAAEGTIDRRPSGMWLTN